jgi:hypothetical protein
MSVKNEAGRAQVLLRHLTEANPSLADVARAAAQLAERALLMRGI